MGPTIGYVIRMFPQLSETFVANEILELESLGRSLQVFSYRNPTEIVGHDCVRRIRTPVVYLPDPLYRHPLRLLRAQETIRRLEPGRYRKVLRRVFGQTFGPRRPQNWRRFVQAADLAVCAKERRVDHLHAHFAHAPTQVTMLASELTGIPFSFTAHARDIYTAAPEFLREKMAAATYVVTCTRANQEHLRTLAPLQDRDKIMLGYHGVDVGKFAPVPGAIPARPPLILSVGRLVEKKGFMHLVEACDVLRRQGHGFRCLIIGEGPERARLEQAVARLGLQSLVSLPGSGSQEEVLKRYREATVFALPCQVLENGDRDGIPNVLVEAMAVGLPVVSSPISGIPELIDDGHSGVLVAECNGNALAAALRSVIEDGALRERLGRNARRTVTERFDSSRNARLLADLIGSRGPAWAGPSSA